MPIVIAYDTALVAIPEGETIIHALDDAPGGLEELRAVLLREHVGRVRDGSSSRADSPSRGEQW